MTRERREKRLDQLRDAYWRGNLSPEEYIKKAFEFKDGDQTREKIMKKISNQLAKATR